MTKTKNKGGRPKNIGINEPTMTLAILMTKDFKNRYKIYCDKHAISMNRRIRLLMEKDMNNQLVFKEEVK